MVSGYLECNRLDSFFYMPLNACQDGSYVVRRAPSVLQDVKTELACPVYIRMEHGAEKLDRRGLIGILLIERHDKPECPVFKRCIGGTNDHRIPV